LREIAETKMPDLNAKRRRGGHEDHRGHRRSMGVEVEA